MTLSEGQTVGNYTILRKLGEGGMGAVYEVQHTEIGRHAAIKILHAQFSQNAQIATRFLNEAKAANRFDHPGVVEIYDSGRLPDGTTYIVMEFLKGDSLAKRLERGPMGLDTLRIARQIASVLAAAHAVGIIHRDLKPDEVGPRFLDGGLPDNRSLERFWNDSLSSNKRRKVVGAAHMPGLYNNVAARGFHPLATRAAKGDKPSMSEVKFEVKASHSAWLSS